MTRTTTAAGETTTSRFETVVATASPRRWARSRAWLRGLALAAAALIAVGGSACRSTEPAPAAQKPAPLPARPREVVADVVISAPAEFWQAAQALGGGPLALLPRGPELALGAALGLPPLVATRLDLRGPAAAVVALSPELAAVLAIRVASGAELIADLTTGAAAAYRAEREGELVVLAPVAPAGSKLALAVLDNALLAGSRPRLAQLSPYLVRSLLARATSEGPVRATLPGAALRELVVPAVRERLRVEREQLVAMEERERVLRGRPADLADPGAVLVALDERIESALAWFSSLAEVRAELALTEARAELQLRLVPEATGSARDGLNSQARGRPLQALALPADVAALVFAMRPATHSPDEGKRLLGRLFGERLKAEDRAAYDGAVDAVDAGLGPAQALGLLPDLRLVWRGDVQDAKLLRRGIHELLWFMQREPVAGLLGRPRPVEKSSRLPGLDESSQRVDVTFAARRAADGGSSRPGKLTFESAVGAERALGGFAWQAESPLSLLVAAERGQRTLAADPLASELIGSAGEVNWLLFADLARLGLTEEAAPFLMKIGSGDGAIAFDVLLTKGAVRAAFALRRWLQ